MVDTVHVRSDMRKIVIHGRQTIDLVSLLDLMGLGRVRGGIGWSRSMGNGFRQDRP